MPLYRPSGGSSSNFSGSSTSSAGVAGLVPAPAAGKSTRYLSSDATFGELPLLPQYKNTAAGAWISVYSPAQATGSGAVNSKVRAFYLLYVPADGNIDTLGFRVATAPTVSSFNFHVAIWEMNEDGTVGSYIIGGNQPSGLSSNTIVSISVSSTAVKRGLYWISGTSDSATTPATISMMAATSTGLYYNFMGGSGFQISNVFFVPNYTATTYNQTTHETFSYSTPAGFGSQTPVMGFQYV